MTIREFIKTLKKHKVDFNKDLAIAFGEEDGEDFYIEEDDFCIFLVKSECEEKTEHLFLHDKK